ncbi:MAG TPA: hypothetical protein DCQ93_06305 [Bacteroidetes bacterium]|nr:hypothetical protein [Bacteroidota bacterium]
MLQKLPIKIFIWLSFLPASSFAQRYNFGTWLGGSTYFGDLNTNTSFKYTRPAGGLYVRYNFDTRICAKASFSYGGVKGMDSASDNYYQQQRNLSFYSSIWEISAQGEFNFMDYSSSKSNMFYTPYFLLGAGIFGFDPHAVYGNASYRLQPIGTEGQGYPEYPTAAKYKLTKPFIVVGGGFKLRVTKTFSMFGEAAVRKTYTDYLDDDGGLYPDHLVLYNEAGPLAVNLSDRSLELGGQPVGAAGKYRADNKRDDYFFFGIGVSYTINTYKCPFLYKDDY